jgi:hypothetical protein
MPSSSSQVTIINFKSTPTTANNAGTDQVICGNSTALTGILYRMGSHPFPEVAALF